MGEKSFFYSPDQEHHLGWTDSEGRPWDMPDRIKSIVDTIVPAYEPSHWHIITELNEAQIRPFITSIHAEAMVDAIKLASQEAAAAGKELTTPYDRDQKDSVTSINANTYQSALSAIECAVSAAESLHNGTSRLASALSRPPGHHAGKDYYHGFCYFNNVAAAANILKANGRKVAIIDIDVHHGDGTQGIFYDDPQVFYSSLHADPNILLPHTGRADEKGIGPGTGTTLNLSYPLGVSVDEYLSLLNDAVRQIEAYKPDYVLISAGFDTHRNEYDNLNLPPITQLDTPDYLEIGKTIGSLSVPSGVILEGGYNQNVLGPSFANLVKGLEEKLQVKPNFDVYSADAPSVQGN